MSFEETPNAPSTPTQDSGAPEQPQTQQASEPSAPAEPPHLEQASEPSAPAEPPHLEQASEPSTPARPPHVEQASEPSSHPAETAGAAAPRSEKEPTMEDFATALETFEQEQAQTEAALNEEQIVTGTVLKVTAQYVVVDIGYKSEGVVQVAEFTDHEGNVTVKRGDEIAVMREPGHTEEGYIHLSHEKAQRLHAWDEIEKAYNDKASVKARVIDRIKGGLTVDILGARAFLPGSQVDLRPVRNLDGLKGHEIEVRIIKLNKKRGNIVASRKQLLEEEQSEKRTKTLEQLHEDGILTGTVKNLTDYGAFVELEQGIEGLVHVSEMTWSKRMKHPSKLVNISDQVEAVVLNVNPQERRISLGLKQLESNPWESLHEKFPVGAVVEGKVRNLTDFGAFIEIEDGIDGLVHVSNLSWTKRVKHPSEVLKKGDKAKAIVLAIEPDQRRLSLGVKQLQPDVWDTFFEQHRVGDVIHGKVLRLASFGAFVEIADGIEGLCHNSEAADAHGAPIKLEPDQEFEFKVIKMNPAEKKVGLSIRAVGGAEATRHDVESYKAPAATSSGTGSTIGEFMSWKRASNENN